MICYSSINLSEPKSETMFLVYMFYVRFALKHSLGFGQMAPHQEIWLCWLCLEKKRWKRSSKNAFITSFVTDFQTSDMYALVVATHVCSSEDGNDDGIHFWIDNFLLR